MTDLTPTQTLDDELNMQNVEAELAAIPLDEVTRAIKDIADGRPVIVVDDADRENEGDIIFAASKATPELLAFMIRYCQRRHLRPDARRGPRPAPRSR